MLEALVTCKGWLAKVHCAKSEGGAFMNKIKKIAYGVASVGLVVPALALAQFDTNVQGTGLSNTSVTGIIKTIMQVLLGLIGTLGVVGFVISGVMYLTAAGEAGIIDRAKRTMVYSIIGILVGLLGLIVVGAIARLLGGNKGI